MLQKMLLVSYRDIPNKFETVQKNMEYMWCAARLGAICVILKTWKTPMDECYF